MKTENDFNAYLSGEFKKFHPDLTFIKVSDKYTPGISDFLLFSWGTCRPVETKFIKEFPSRGTTKVLTHEFSGTQQSFLHKLEKTYNHGFGVVACLTNKIMYVIRQKYIPKNGNWTKDEFMEAVKAEHFKLFEFGDINTFLHYLFMEHEEMVYVQNEDAT